MAMHSSGRLTARTDASARRSPEARLTRREKPFVADVQPLGIRAISLPSRDHSKLGPVELLDPMLQHRAIDFVEYVVVDGDNPFGADSQNVAVVRSVVDLAQGQPVRRDWLALRLPVLDDVSGIEEIAVSQAAHRAPSPVGEHDLGPKRRLMQPLLGHP